MHHVLNRKPIGWWGETEFYRTGEEDAQRLIDVFCTDHKISTKTRTCLEIGCGAGRVTKALATRFRRVIALDVSDAMLDFAQERVLAENVQWVRGTGIDLAGVDDASVSFVFSTMVFQHIPDPQIQYTYLREIARVLRPGGWYLIHLYADQTDYARKKTAWEKRAAGQVLLGWSEAARPELVEDNYKTSMCTPVADQETRAVLADAGLSLIYEDGKETSVWMLGGQKSA